MGKAKRYRVGVYSLLAGLDAPEHGHTALDRVREKICWYKPRYHSTEQEARKEAEFLSQSLEDLTPPLAPPFDILVLVSDEADRSVVQILRVPSDG